MNEELLKIIEGMQAENKALTDQGEQAIYGDTEFKNVVKAFEDSIELKPKSLQEIQDSLSRGEQSAFNRGPDGKLLDEGYTMNDLGEVVFVGEEIETTSKTKEVPTQPGVAVTEDVTASESVDTILPSYYEKPKTAEEVQQSLFNIKETTDNTDEIVINRSVEEYFENPLKDFDKWLETTGKQTQVKKGTAKQGYYYEGVPLSDSERQGYLKEYLGEKKYNEYVEWDKGDGTQNLPIGSEDFDRSEEHTSELQSHA